MSSSTSSTRAVRDAAGGAGEHPQVVAAAAARVEVVASRAAPTVGSGSAARRSGGRRSWRCRRWVDQPEQHPQRRGLAGAVRAEEAGDPAGLDVEAQVVDRDEGAEALGEPSDLDLRPRRGGRASWGTSWCHAPILAASGHVRVIPRWTGLQPRGTRGTGNAEVSPYDGPIMTPWLLLLLGVVLTVGTALFVAAEFSLVALDRPTVQRAVDAGDAGPAESVLTSHRRLSTQLSARQLGITADHPGASAPREPVDRRAADGPARVGWVLVGAGRVGGGGRRSRDADRHGVLDGRRRDGAQDPGRLGCRWPPRRSRRRPCGRSPSR